MLKCFLALGLQDHVLHGSRNKPGPDCEEQWGGWVCAALWQSQMEHGGIKGTCLQVLGFTQTQNEPQAEAGLKPHVALSQ